MKESYSWVKPFKSKFTTSSNSLRLDSKKDIEPMQEIDMDKINPIVGFGKLRMKQVRSLSDEDLDFVINANHVTSFVKEVAINEKNQRINKIS